MENFEANRKNKITFSCLSIWQVMRWIPNKKNGYLSFFFLSLFSSCPFSSHLIKSSKSYFAVTWRAIPAQKERIPLQNKQKRGSLWHLSKGKGLRKATVEKRQGKVTKPVITKGEQRVQPRIFHLIDFRCFFCKRDGTRKNKKEMGDGWKEREREMMAAVRVKEIEQQDGRAFVTSEHFQLPISSSSSFPENFRDWNDEMM